MFEKIKKYYEQGLWDESRVREAVIRGVINGEQFRNITGKNY